MKVLVTGGGGFLGRYILEQLIKRGYQTGCLARGSYPELEDAGVQMHRGSLTDEAFVLKAHRGYDAVIHVAARAGFWGAKHLFWEPNVLGTAHVLRACKEHKISRLVFTSSPSVVFSNDAQTHADESLSYPETYESAYPESKAKSEQMVLGANSTELMTCSLRPHLIFGPRDTHLLPTVITRAVAGKLIQIGDGSNQVDLTYVEDAARAHILALERLTPGSAVCGSAYFISQDEPITLWPWINDLLITLNIPPVTKKISLKTARFLGGMVESVYRTFNLSGDPRLTRFLASELAKDHFYNIQKAMNELDYKPEYSMEKALSKTLPSLRELTLLLKKRG